MAATGVVERANCPPQTRSTHLQRSHQGKHLRSKKPKPIDLKQKTADISAKIAASCKKLADKFREKAQRAAEKVKDTKGEEKRALYRRRFELYGDAVSDLEDRLRQLQRSDERGSD